MSALDRLLKEADDAGVDFGLWKQGGTAIPENRYEVRVFGQNDVRFIERGETAYEAAAKAADRLGASP